MPPVARFLRHSTLTSCNETQEQRSRDRSGAGALFVFALDVASGVVAHHRGRRKRDDGTGGDVPGNRVGRVILAEQPRCDQRRRPAGDDGGELIAERGAAVAQLA